MTSSHGEYDCWEEWRMAGRHIRQTRQQWEPNVEKGLMGVLYRVGTPQERHYKLPQWLSNHSAMTSLLRQGCQSPPQHYYADHECQILGRRIEVLREINRWRQNGFVVDLMLEKLSEAVLVQIFGWLVLMSHSQIKLVQQDDLRDVGSLLAGPGLCRSTESLTALAERALLENSLCSVHVDFPRVNGRKVASLLPQIREKYAPWIWHLQLSIPLQMTDDRVVYPNKLYAATARMPSLYEVFLLMKTLYLRLLGSLTESPQTDTNGFTMALNTQCRKGFSGVTTLRRSIEELIDAERRNKPPKVRIVLEFHYKYTESWHAWSPLPPEMAVNVGNKPAAEVVAEADAKYH